MDALKEVNRVMFSPERFLKVFSMDQQTLALRAHVHRNTVRNAPESEKVQAYIRDSVKVLRAVTDMGTDVTNAIFWFKNEPLSTFNYKTAEEVVSEGKTEQLIAFLQSWEAGAQG
jgi:DNA-binding XRE family transcriptional regulator